MPRNDKVVRRMLTTEEAAAHLGTTVRHIRRLVSDHQLSHYKVGAGTASLTSTSTPGWMRGG